MFASIAYIWKKIQAFLDATVQIFFFVAFSTITLDRGAALFIKDSKPFGFYASLYAFEPLTLAWYILNVLQVIVNALICVPFFLSIVNKRPPFRKLWAYLLVLKVFFDLTGHYYHFIEYSSLFHIKWTYGLSAFIAHALIWFPSYTSTFRATSRHR